MSSWIRSSPTTCRWKTSIRPSILCMKARAFAPSFISDHVGRIPLSPSAVFRWKTLRGFPRYGACHDPGKHLLPEKLRRLAQALPTSLEHAQLRHGIRRLPAAAGRAGHQTAGALLAVGADL